MHESHRQLPCQDVEVTRYLTRNAVFRYLDHISNLNKDALLNTLIPYRDLPTADPAGYLIARHNQLASDAVHVEALRTTYDLGVVLGRSLLKESLPAAEDLPVISEFNEEKQQQVDGYLAGARRYPAGILPHDQSLETPHDLARAIELFGQRCEVIVPHLMIDGRAELVRGCYDYLNVVQLLEMEAAPATEALQRFLGRTSLEAGSGTPAQA